MEIFSFKIVKHYKLGYRKLIDEAAFVDYTAGIEWLNQEFFNSEFYNSEYRAEVVKFKKEGNSWELKIIKRFFNFSGEEYSSNEGSISEDIQTYDYNFVPKFSMGDLVLFEDLVDLSCRTLKDTIAVVTGVPLTFKERSSNSIRIKNLDYTDQMYMIEHITHCGTLEHWHILEEDLKPFHGRLPIELQAMEYLSLHFGGEKQIDGKILQKMMNGEIYMLNRTNWHEVI